MRLLSAAVVFSAGQDVVPDSWEGVWQGPVVQALHLLHHAKQRTVSFLGTWQSTGASLATGTEAATESEEMTHEDLVELGQAEPVSAQFPVVEGFSDYQTLVEKQKHRDFQKAKRTTTPPPMAMDTHHVDPQMVDPFLPTESESTTVAPTTVAKRIPAYEALVQAGQAADEEDVTETFSGDDIAEALHLATTTLTPTAKPVKKPILIEDTAPPQEEITEEDIET
eukprot:CAMPEP_0204341166 /NCGR_PEP_ID=MMETSP0469-20131031/23140_1 /ASSEMBLY_ACC=CAM_ASM_000384 /TAXON_ID=2969 /ORGANISM="Oxyrrhis marina" /LENGTH=223 /DNA_ID=CAMNT_0051325839 /DNA_START=69 /DNA_END=736 /DNA_ORIENTATION=+